MNQPSGEEVTKTEEELIKRGEEFIQALNKALERQRVIQQRTLTYKIKGFFRRLFRGFA